MCQTSWALLKGFRALEIISGVPTFKAANQYFKNKSFSAASNFAIAVSKAKNGGDYNLVMTKLTDDDVTMSLPANSKVSGSGETTITLTGEESTKFWFNFTFDGIEYIWTLLGVSSAGGAGTSDEELLAAAAEYSDEGDSNTLNQAQLYCDGQLVNLPELVPSTYTFVLADKDKLKIMDALSIERFIVPTNATVPFPIGTRIHTTTKGFQTFFLASEGVTIHSADDFLRLRTRFACATIIKINLNEWLLSGDLSL